LMPSVSLVSLNGVPSERRTRRTRPSWS
jgi:hypothetical protein